ncbi:MULTISPECIES: ABC transporter ATP-binding protein [Streptococcus]|uniref:ABC transporter ATP-binding protein n=1 Tax=Streptococcus TaxID=1301 RepID=UPI00040DE3E5|nr:MULTISPECIES: ABC transporter ATP-binding protein [Streptococcus]NQM28887.1 ABC transporter ATP-binding protein [Streptococcus suis]HEL1701860.1 ABC transporter ATP-binding protein [Streptococcus suis]HEM3212150.1 ABC transporter ATP-binding protein [Streptococcus suis NT77]HEM4251990.1 ABC transporter ATP-binding protein [Streptococcus suis]HEM6232766.1 ABC transporter ATP-binding protein [Streptococcus suis]
MDNIIIENLGFKYGDYLVLKDINVTLKKGDVVGLVGKNGVGKTTFMKLISGILPGYTGKVTVHAETIGVLIEEPSLYKDLSVKRNLEFYCKLYNKSLSEIDKLESFLNIKSFMNKKVSSLSLGMKQRVGLFVALIASNEIVLLDEPTNGLDPEGIRDLLNLIKELSVSFNITFIVSSHILSNLEQICNKYILMKEQTVKLIDLKESKYKIYPHNISQEELMSLLRVNKLNFEKNSQNIVVSNIEEVEKLLKIEKIEFKKEPVKISEVYFHEK